MEIEKHLTVPLNEDTIYSASEKIMKKLLLVLLIILLPQTALSQEIIWGSDNYKNLGIECSKPLPRLKEETNNEINIFLSRYRRNYIKTNLKKIVVCKELTRYGHDFYRGTYDQDTKTLFVETGDGKLNDTEYVLHHEFSSLIWLNKMDEKMISKWKSFSNFEYKIEGNIVSDWSINTLDQENGALYRYCKTTPENDFNVVAAFYISDYLRPLVLQAQRKHMRIRGKVLIIKEVYRGILK